jgi:hypothetical protein
VQAPAAWARERVGRWFTVEELDAERARLTTNADTVDWPAFALGLVDADFVVLSPPELVARIGDWAARFGRAAASSPAAVGRDGPV